jgi:hypothetical protein
LLRAPDDGSPRSNHEALDAAEQPQTGHLPDRTAGAYPPPKREAGGSSGVRIMSLERLPCGSAVTPSSRLCGSALALV